MHANVFPVGGPIGRYVSAKIDSSQLMCAAAFFRRSKLKVTKALFYWASAHFSPPCRRFFPTEWCQIITGVCPGNPKTDRHRTLPQNQAAFERARLSGLLGNAKGGSARSATAFAGLEEGAGRYANAFCCVAIRSARAPAKRVMPLRMESGSRWASSITSFSMPLVSH
jgi:hypothetical protein